LHAVLYGCEIWSLTLRDVHGLRAFGNRVARRILGSNRDEVTTYLRKFYNGKLNNVFPCQIILIIKSRRMRWTGNVVHMGEEWSASIILERKPESGIQLGTPRNRRGFY
jgi:hypothetical protein